MSTGWSDQLTQVQIEFTQSTADFSLMFKGMGLAMAMGSRLKWAVLISWSKLMYTYQVDEFNPLQKLQPHFFHLLIIMVLSPKTVKKCLQIIVVKWWSGSSFYEVIWTQIDVLTMLLKWQEAVLTLSGCYKHLNSMY